MTPLVMYLGGSRWLSSPPTNQGRKTKGTQGKPRKTKGNPTKTKGNPTKPTGNQEKPRKTKGKPRKTKKNQEKPRKNPRKTKKNQQKPNKTHRNPTFFQVTPPGDPQLLRSPQNSPHCAHRSVPPRCRGKRPERGTPFESLKKNFVPCFGDFFLWILKMMVLLSQKYTQLVFECCLFG